MSMCRLFLCRQCYREIAGCKHPDHAPETELIDSCAVCAQDKPKGGRPKGS